MFRDLLSNRFIQAGLVFCVLIVGGSQLYYWHVRRTSEVALEQHDRFLREYEKQIETAKYFLRFCR